MVLVAASTYERGMMHERIWPNDMDSKLQPNNASNRLVRAHVHGSFDWIIICCYSNEKTTRFTQSVGRQVKPFKNKIIMAQNDVCTVALIVWTLTWFFNPALIILSVRYLNRLGMDEKTEHLVPITIYPISTVISQRIVNLWGGVVFKYCKISRRNYIVPCFHCWD